jgi:hypothetical protein
MKSKKVTLIILELLFSITFGNIGISFIISNLVYYSGVIENIIFGSIIIFTFTLIGILLPRIILESKTAKKIQFKSIEFASLGIFIGIIFSLIPALNLANTKPNNFADSYYYGVLISEPLFAPMILGVILYNFSLASKNKSKS